MSEREKSAVTTVGTGLCALLGCAARRGFAYARFRVFESGKTVGAKTKLPAIPTRIPVTSPVTNRTHRVNKTRRLSPGAEVRFDRSGSRSSKRRGRRSGGQCILGRVHAATVHSRDKPARARFRRQTDAPTQKIRRHPVAR